MAYKKENDHNRNAFDPGWQAVQQQLQYLCLEISVLMPGSMLCIFIWHVLTKFMVRDNGEKRPAEK